MNTIVYLSIIIVAMTASALFSGMEAGVLALNPLRIRTLRRKGERRAEILHTFLQKPEEFFWSILVGNTIANFTVVGLTAFFLRRHAQEHPVWFWGGLAAIVFVLYAACDLLPKMVFRMFPNRFCMAMAKPFRIAYSLLRPFTWAASRLAHSLAPLSGGKVYSGQLFGTREEMRMLMQESSQNLTSEERAMINRVLDLQKLTVRDVAVPLEKAITVSDKTTMSEVMAICRERHVSRLPVWSGEDATRRIAGILSLRTALFREDFNPERRAGDYLRPALYLDGDTRLEEALARFRRSGERLAIVLERDRKEAGLISLQDIWRAIFGEVNV